MKAPRILQNGTSTGYGFGLISGQYRGVATLSHPGGVMGGNAQMLKVPAAALDIVILVNRHDVSAVELAQNVLAVCLPGLPEGSRDAPAALTGLFRSSVTDRVVSLFSRSGRQLVAIDGYEMPVAPDVDGVLWPTGMFNYVKQGIRVLGAPGALELDDFGTLDRLQAVGSAGAADFVDGCYRSVSTQTELRLAGGDLYVRGKFGNVQYRLECLAPGVWQARSNSTMPWGGVLVFNSERTQLRFSNNWRTRGLPFLRCA